MVWEMGRMSLCPLSSRGKTAISPRGRDTDLGLKSQTSESQCKWCWLVPWNGHFIWKSKYYELKTSGARVCSSFWLLLLLLSCFSRVWLCATPQTAAHQAPRPWDSPGPGQSLLCTPQLACRAFYTPLDCLQQCNRVVARWTTGPEYLASFGLPLASNPSLKLTPRQIKGRLRKEILNFQEIMHLRREGKDNLFI